MQHQAILDAIAAGRRAAAERAMQQHMREIFKSLPRLAQAHPEMFEAQDAAHRATARSREAVR